ncbi:hypothetical protein B7P43_G06049 [Cryptotermes secundus]|uniref:Uncharacterized protein n=1 Tax=Cryptotermes secundus TaxID=105785 RepID=A0A2J7RSN1_9NEOP|nr:hypothetical protein B7P43_G06049 [Cryptotermes secundus]
MSPIEFCTEGYEDRNREREVEESIILEAVVRKRMVRTRQAGKDLAGAMASDTSWVLEQPQRHQRFNYQTHVDPAAGFGDSGGPRFEACNNCCLIFSQALPVSKLGTKGTEGSWKLLRLNPEACKGHKEQEKDAVITGFSRLWSLVLICLAPMKLNPNSSRTIPMFPDDIFIRKCRTNAVTGRFGFEQKVSRYDGRCTCEIKSRIAMAKAAFSKKKNLFTSKLDLNLRKKLVKCYIWSIALYGAETWTLRAVDQKHLESFEMWCWRRMEKISWTDYVRNEEVLIRVSEQRNILHEIRKRKANWIGHVLRRNCLLKEAIEGKIDGRIEVTRRRGRRRKKMLDDLGDRRGYCHLKEKALDRIKWRNCFERDCGPVVLTDY